MPNERETVVVNGRTLILCPFGHGDTLYPVAFPTEADLEGHLDSFHSYVGRKR